MVKRLESRSPADWFCATKRRGSAEIQRLAWKSRFRPVEFLPSALHSPCATGSPEPIRSFRNWRLTHCYPLVQPVGMSKADGAFLTIGELAKELNLPQRSEEHTSELQSLMRISYAVYCLKKKNTLYQ